MERNINDKCKHYFLGYCHIYLGGMCSSIENVNINQNKRHEKVFL